MQSGNWTLAAVLLAALILSRCSGPKPIHEKPGEAKVSLEDLIDRAEQGEVEAQVSLGLRYRHGMRAPQDSKEALKWFQRASRQGNAFAQARLGALYRDGLGVAQNHAEAVKWFRKSADQGNSTAQVALGIMYWKGMGVPRDDREALKWLRSVRAPPRPSELPGAPFDYWEVPPIAPSPIRPFQVGAVRQRDRE